MRNELTLKGQKVVLRFKASRTFFEGKRKVYAVLNPKRCASLGWLVGLEVRIDGIEFLVRDARGTARNGVYRRRDPIELLVDEVPDRDGFDERKTIRGIDYLG